MKVPFVDLGAQHREMEAELREAFDRVLRNSSFIMGTEVGQFETAFASYLNATSCVAVNSGTAALHLVLQALGIGPGDQVITVPNTFIATAEAISAVGAQPVFVDVDPISYTMDPQQVERAITPHSRAILPVHLYGQTADLDPLLDIAARHNLPLIEDACQAHGSEYKGRKVGTLGVAGCFSFYPSKNLGCCGEGGAIATNDPDLAQRVRLLRNHGSVSKYEHSIPAYNFRMEGLQGAFLAAKLKHLDEWNERRRAIAELYDSLLENAGVVVPVEMPYSRHVYHLYVIQTEERDSLRQKLADNDVEAGVHYPIPLHLQEAYRSLGYRAGDFPVCERLTQRILSLPIYPELPTEAVSRVVGSLQEHVANCARLNPLGKLGCGTVSKAQIQLPQQNLHGHARG
jgi:dTDP-4-amino-4,6-dideoxygalactose transaminase